MVFKAQNYFECFCILNISQQFVSKSQTLNIKLFIQEGCSLNKEIFKLTISEANP